MAISFKTQLLQFFNEGVRAAWASKNAALSVVPQEIKVNSSVAAKIALNDWFTMMM